MRDQMTKSFLYPTLIPLQALKEQYNSLESREGAGSWLRDLMYTYEMINTAGVMTLFEYGGRGPYYRRPPSATALAPPPGPQTRSPEPACKGARAVCMIVL